MKGFFRVLVVEFSWTICEFRIGFIHMMFKHGRWSISRLTMGMIDPSDLQIIAIEGCVAQGIASFHPSRKTFNQWLERWAEWLCAPLGIDGNNSIVEYLHQCSCRNMQTTICQPPLQHTCQLNSLKLKDVQMLNWTVIVHQISFARQNQNQSQNGLFPRNTFLHILIISKLHGSWVYELRSMLALCL